MNEPEARKESERATERIAALVRENGDEVAYEEPPCILWRADHKDCKGCPYHLGCDKVVRLLTLMLGTLSYKPHSFTDFSSMVNHLEEQKRKILEAKTLDELRLIPKI